MNPNNQKPDTIPVIGPQPPAQPVPHDPYGFILNAPKAPKRKLLKSNSLKSRLLIVVGGALIVMFAIILISSLVKKSGNEAAADLKSLVAEQQEIIRVAGSGSTASDLVLQSWAETTLATVSSQQSKLTASLTKNSIILLPTELASKLNKNTDTAFKDAMAKSNFDDVFKSTLQSDLVTYSKDLKITYNKVKSPTIKSLLSSSYKDTAILLK